MKVLLCAVPDGPIDKTVEPMLRPWGLNDSSYLFMPLGALRVAEYVENHGYPTEVYDINSIRGTDEELIRNFKKINPSVVGLGGPLTHCYPNIKRIAKILRELFPNIWIIGGGAITGSANVLLERTETDICVIGDGEIPFLELLEYIKLHPTHDKFDYNKLSKIRGLAFLDENNKLKVTGNAKPLSASEASEVHYPNYEKLKDGLDKYLGNGELIYDFFGTIDNLSALKDAIFEEQLYPDSIKFFNKYKGYKIGLIMSAQGCVARCTFCQRYLKGYRPYKPKDFEAHLIELKEKYNVRIVTLADDNSLSDRKQGYEMARILKKHDIYWTAGGVRATTCTYEDLKFYKENNLLAVRFGIESGSKKILEIMEKKIKKEDVYNTLANCRKLGIAVATNMFMLGMPGETRETVLETSEFSGKLRYLVGKDWNISNTTLAMAIPGTPLYEYCQQVGFLGKTMDEEEDYLIRTSELSNKNILSYSNKTDASIEEVHYWGYLYKYGAKKTFVEEIFRNNKSLKKSFLEFNEKCLKASYIRLDAFYKKKGYKKSFIKHFYQLTLQTMITLSISFVPRAIFFYMLRMFANFRYRNIEKKYKQPNGKQIHNCFVNPKVKLNDEFVLTQDKIKKSTREIELSLRTIVKENRQQMKPAVTDEEKGLNILAQGQ